MNVLDGILGPKGLTRNQVLIKYARLEDGHPYGVVVAVKNGEGGFNIGWSACHSKFDSWNRSMGLSVAIGRAVQGQNSILAVEDEEIGTRHFWGNILPEDAEDAFTFDAEVPHRIIPEVDRMIERATRYFLKD